MKLLFSCLLMSVFIISCKSEHNQPSDNDDYLILISDIEKSTFGYVNSEGDTIIPFEKYACCFTDTFKTYAIVTSPEKGYNFICIDRNENIKYHVFPFDNGPDYVCEGLFRIIENEKIGYADSATGEIVIEPQFSCAYPFREGIAEVSYSCEERPIGEYHEWISNEWFFIDKSGNRIENEK